MPPIPDEIVLSLASVANISPSLLAALEKRKAESSATPNPVGAVRVVSPAAMVRVQTAPSSLAELERTRSRGASALSEEYGDQRGDPVVTLMPPSSLKSRNASDFSLIANPDDDVCRQSNRSSPALPGKAVGSTVPRIASCPDVSQLEHDRFLAGLPIPQAQLESLRTLVGSDEERRDSVPRVETWPGILAVEAIKEEDEVVHQEQSE